jgi:hypothetical protein
MPDLTIEVALICPMWASNFEVASESSNDSYLAQFHPYDPANCQCKSFKFSGDYGNQYCKHLRKVEENGCFYHPERSQHPGVKAWNEFQFENNGIVWLSSGGSVMEPKQPCPGCGNPMIVVRIAV